MRERVANLQTTPDWNDLKILLTFLRTGTLKAAARKLALSASTVSRRLVALEAALGSRLFNRTAAGLTATPLARSLLLSIERAEQATAEVVRTVSGQSTGVEGTVRVALPEAIALHALVPTLPLLRAQQPNLSLTLLTGWQPADLSRLEADIDVRSIRPRHADVVIRAVATFQYRAYATARYLARRVPFDQLDWVWNDGAPNATEMQWVLRHLPHVRPAISAGSLNVVLQAVLAGLGVALLPESLVQAHRTLKPVPLPFGAPPAVTYYLAVHRDLRNVPRVAAVWDFLVDHLSQRLNP
jgi:DNA-binding transcriptional LysR family regulator